MRITSQSGALSLIRSITLRNSIRKICFLQGQGLAMNAEEVLHEYAARPCAAERLTSATRQVASLPREKNQAVTLNFKGAGHSFLHGSSPLVSGLLLLLLLLPLLLHLHLQLHLQLHCPYYVTVHHTTLHFCLTTLHYTSLPYMTHSLHYTHYTTKHATATTLHYSQLQLHYDTTTTTAAPHQTTSSSCGWADRPGDHCTHCNHSKKHNSNQVSFQQWIRSAISDSQQPSSCIGFPCLKLPPPPCAVLVVFYIYIYIYICILYFIIFLYNYDQLHTYKLSMSSSY